MIKKASGFSLIEVSIALVLISGFFLVLMQFKSQEHRAQLIDAATSHLQAITAEVQRFEAQQRRFPSAPAELSMTRSTTPWNEPYQLTLREDEVDIEVRYPSAFIAKAIAAQVLNAKAVSDQITLTIGSTFEREALSMALHRVAIPGAPELNRMEADLDMNQHALSNVGRLTTELMQVDSAYIESLSSETLTTESVAVSSVLEANLLTAETADIDVVTTSQFTADFAQIQDLVATDMSIERLQVSEMNAEYAYIDTLETLTLETQALSAELITAQDFFTGSVYLSELQQQFELLRAEWAACLASGGCQ
ncbi:MAG: type 2a secretion system minor pilin protein PulH [Idiomarinaceae bacterium HL-53]|nr:MAG: type 2a secretion system minor pilin protein PulH [Idiomarinaceae bacterium HL-53]CUS49387.1 prepilin-type N-terminal cleavage/methylation domain-containing protein [Idiomarinaceae bacterium HL-53]